MYDKLEGRFDGHMKNNIWKEGIITTIIGAILGVIVTYFTDNLGITQSSINIKWVILLFLLALTLLLLCLIFIRIDTIKTEQIKLFTDTFYGFRAVDEDISEFAIRKLKRCSMTRIVGTARDESLGKNGTATALEYLKCIEEKLQEKKYFVCRRVTSSHVVSKEYREHLKNCLEITSKNKNIFEIIYIEDFDFNISYQIFDDNGLLVIVDNLVNNDYMENSLGLWTENKDIIQSFINRFDYGWDKIKIKKTQEI